VRKAVRARLLVVDDAAKRSAARARAPPDVLLVTGTGSRVSSDNSGSGGGGDGGCKGDSVPEAMEAGLPCRADEAVAVM